MMDGPNRLRQTKPFRLGQTHDANSDKGNEPSPHSVERTSHCPRGP